MQPPAVTIRRRFACTTLLVGGVLVALAGPATAQTPPRDPVGGIDVVQVDGLLDPPNAALVEDAITRAADRGSSLLVFQLDASGAVDVDVERLVDAIEASRVPVAVWIGPSRARAQGAAALLALTAPVVAAAPGAGIGPVDPVNLDRPSEPTRDDLEQRVGVIQEDRGRDADTAAALVGGRLGAREAVRAGAIDRLEPTVGDFIVSLDGRVVQTVDGAVRLSTARLVNPEGSDFGDARRQPNQEVRFAKLGLGAQVAHTLVSPWVAYFLFVVGIALMIFEFYTAGVGIAGVVGAGAFVGALFGFSHLPVHWWAAALLVVGMLGLTIDLQAGGLGPWTVLGAASLVAGSVTLYGGSSRLDPAWWIVAGVCGGAVLFVLGGMTAMVRARFSTPTVGREDLVGELGDAEVDVAPDGVVRVRDALWRARTNRATPLRAGDRVRVVAIDGVVLEVEPESGGARDHRDRARRRD